MVFRDPNGFFPDFGRRFLPPPARRPASSRCSRARRRGGAFSPWGKAAPLVFAICPVWRLEMLGGAPGTAACVAAGGILVAEAGTHGLALGAALFVLLGLLWVGVGVVRAWWVLRGRVPIVPWRPNFLVKVYKVSRGNLLDRVSRRMDALSCLGDARGDGSGNGNPNATATANANANASASASASATASADANTQPGTQKQHPHRVFGAVIGTCPFAHVGSAELAQKALADAPKKAPLYHAFAAFAGGSVFTAEGSDHVAKRGEVLGAFATAGLEPLALASKKAAKRLTQTMDEKVGNAADEIQMLPLVQRATLRATFEYLAGCSIDEAVTEFGHGSNEDALKEKNKHGSEILEDEYLQAATALRHLIPARARSVWILSDVLYGLSPVGRLETRSISAARTLPLLALRAARKGSPLDLLARGEAHGGQALDAHQQKQTLKPKSFYETYMGFGVFLEKQKSQKNSWTGPRLRNPPKALVDECVTLLFAGHDTQSATLSWALLRLASDSEGQNKLRASLRAVCFDDFKVAEDLGLDDLLRVGVASTRELEDGGRGFESGTGQKDAPRAPAWRASSAVPVLEAVLRETLRLHPVAPLVVRNLTHDLIGNDVSLPAGTAVGVWLHAVHRDPKVWDLPDLFTPDRWLEGDGKTVTVKRKGSAFMPFATGPRACVGQHLAWVFLRVTLARLVAGYEFTACDNRTDDMTPSVGFTVTPASAGRVRVTRVM